MMADISNLVEPSQHGFSWFLADILYPSFGLLLSPIVAAGAMALPSVSVIANALRLRFVKVG